MTASLKHWHWTRWLRLVVAAAFLGQGVASGDSMAYAFGTLLGLQAVLNIGCCAAGTCSPATRPTTDTQDISYQKIQ